MKVRLAIVLILLVVILAFGGCDAYESPGEPLPIEETPSPFSNPGNTSSSDLDTETRLVDQTWISPGLVQVGNYYPGARAEWDLRLHNGEDTIVEYLISYREPGSTKTGYDMPPLGTEDWIIIADPTPILAPKETREILVTLAIPKDAGINSQKWEFWVSVIKIGQGMVQTELCSRWLVNMRS